MKFKEAISNPKVLRIKHQNSPPGLFIEIDRDCKTGKVHVIINYSNGRKEKALVNDRYPLAVKNAEGWNDITSTNITAAATISKAPLEDVKEVKPDAPTPEFMKGLAKLREATRLEEEAKLKAKQTTIVTQTSLEGEVKGLSDLEKAQAMLKKQS